MTIRNLTTRNKEKQVLPSRREEEHPFITLQKRMNELFDSFFHGFDMESPDKTDIWRGDFSPHIDIKEGEKDIEIIAELPGMDENDLEVLLESDILTIKGEKKEKKEEKEKNYWHMERRYGAFYRTIPLPEAIETDEVQATFKKGVLHITLPKMRKAMPAGRKIEINTE